MKCHLNCDLLTPLIQPGLCFGSSINLFVLSTLQPGISSGAKKIKNHPECQSGGILGNLIFRSGLDAEYLDVNQQFALFHQYSNYHKNYKELTISDRRFSQKEFRPRGAYNFFYLATSFQRNEQENHTIIL